MRIVTLAVAAKTIKTRGETRREIHGSIHNFICSQGYTGLCWSRLSGNYRRNTRHNTTLYTLAHARMRGIPPRLIIYIYIYIRVCARVYSWLNHDVSRHMDVPLADRCGIACRVLLGRMETSTWPSTPPRDSISIPSRFHARDIIRNPHRARASSASKKQG